MQQRVTSPHLKLRCAELLELLPIDNSGELLLARTTHEFSAGLVGVTDGFAVWVGQAVRIAPDWLVMDVNGHLWPFDLRQFQLLEVLQCVHEEV